MNSIKIGYLLGSFFGAIGRGTGKSLAYQARSPRQLRCLRVSLRFSSVAVLVLLGERPVIKDAKPPPVNLFPLL